MATWTSGGRSLDALPLAGWYSFSVPGGAAGVVAGLNRNDTTADPGEIERGLTFSGGVVRVIEVGSIKTAGMSYASEDVFHIVRTATNDIYYCYGTTPTVAAGVPFLLPGEVIYKSATPLVGSAYLDASLFMLGDQVVGAGLTLLDGAAATDGGGADLHFEPLVIAASEGVNDGAAISFRPMTLSALSEEESGASLHFLPLILAASEGDDAGASIAFEPMTVAAAEGMPALVDGADLSFEPLSLYAVSFGSDGAVVDITFEPLVARGGEGDLAEAVMSFEPMYAFGFIAESPVPALYITLPSIGNWEMIPDVEEVGEGWEEVFTDSFRMMLEVGEGLEILAHTSITQAMLEDMGTGSDATSISASWAIEDIGEGLDEVVSTGSIMAVEEIGEGLEEVFPAGATIVALEDVGDGSDATFIAASWSIEDIGEVLDATAISSIASLEDIGEGLEEVFGSSTTQRLAEDVGEGLDDVFYTSIGVQTVVDVGEGEDSILLRNPHLTAWVMNSKTGGVAWYENWPFTGMCVVDGKVLAVGPEGLAVVGGDTDAGESINAAVEFGLTDFSGYTQDGTPKNNDPQRKRVESFWIGYHATGVLNATVETIGQTSYTYTMAARPANSPRNNRIVPGKGLSARYWRITLANTAGCDFEVNNMAADIARSSRRL